jgi:crossover junction endodeoxyribonuclease RusA
MRGVMVKSNEARQYALEVAALTHRMRPLECQISVRMDFYRPRQAGDLDNRLKAVLDALQGTAFINDNQVVEIIARRFDDAKKPRVEVTISEAKMLAA